MRLFWDNLIDDIAIASITSATQLSTLPDHNVQNELKTKVWRTKTAPTGLNAVVAAGGSLTASTTYYYKVAWYDAVSDSYGSAEANATTTVSDKTINLTWTAVSGATGYRVYRTTTAGSYPASSLISSPTSASLSDTGLSASSGQPITSEYVRFDLGSAQAATSCVIFNHTLGASEAPQLRASTDNFSASDVLIGTFTHSTGPMLLTFGSSSYRYWQLKWTKNPITTAVDIGRVFLGPYTEILGQNNVNPFDMGGYKELSDDLSQKQKSRGGQTYVDRIAQFKKWKLSMSYMTQANRDSIVTFSEAVGEHTSFFFQADTASPLDTIYYTKLTRLAGREIVAWDGAHIWDLELELEEQL